MIHVNIHIPYFYELVHSVAVKNHNSSLISSIYSKQNSVRTRKHKHYPRLWKIGSPSCRWIYSGNVSSMLQVSGRFQVHKWCYPGCSMYEIYLHSLGDWCWANVGCQIPAPAGMSSLWVDPPLAIHPGLDRDLRTIAGVVTHVSNTMICLLLRKNALLLRAQLSSTEISGDLRCCTS